MGVVAMGMAASGEVTLATPWAAGGPGLHGPSSLPPPTLPQLLCTLVSYTGPSPLLQATCFMKPFLTSLSRLPHAFFVLRIIYQFLSSRAYQLLVLCICFGALLEHGPHRGRAQRRLWRLAELAVGLLSATY